MCGIAGIRRFGKTVITAEEIITLLVAIEHRGQHATGIALVNDDVKVHKAPIPAWRFCQTDEFQMFLAENLNETTKMALLHTRWSTGANPEDNQNNHPMFDGDTAITHNGGIHNSEGLFNGSNYKKSCATDSDIIRAIVSEHGFHEKGIRELNKMIGSAAIACVSNKYPEELLLARSGSPLCYGWNESDDKMYWASEAQAIIKAGRAQYRDVRGTWTQPARTYMSVGIIPDHTAWLFDDQRRILHAEFKTCALYRQPDYSRGRQTYHTKRSEWKHQKKMEAARKKAAANFTPLTPTANIMGEKIPRNSIIICNACGGSNNNPKGMDWKDLGCWKCDTNLGV